MLEVLPHSTPEFGRRVMQRRRADASNRPQNVTSRPPHLGITPVSVRRYPLSSSVCLLRHQNPAGYACPCASWLGAVTGPDNDTPPLHRVVRPHLLGMPRHLLRMHH